MSWTCPAVIGKNQHQRVCGRRFNVGVWAIVHLLEHLLARP